MRTIRRQKAGKKQENPKMPKNGTFGLLEIGGNGQMLGYAPSALTTIVNVYLVDVK
jgi:hypothetical protein